MGESSALTALLRRNFRRILGVQSLALFAVPGLGISGAAASTGGLLTATVFALWYQGSASMMQL